VRALGFGVLPRRGSVHEHHRVVTGLGVTSLHLGDAGADGNAGKSVLGRRPHEAVEGARDTKTVSPPKATSILKLELLCPRTGALGIVLLL